jgi:1-acyl-sn-glycerol-3-phosphate acyltransferase
VEVHERRLLSAVADDAPAAGRTGSALHSLFYSSVRLASRPAFAAWFRLRREGIENIPADGPVIVAGNHVSYLDPAVLGSACPRPVRFLISAQVWQHRSMNWFYRGMRSIPVDRSGGPTRAAIRAALAALEDGEVVGIFPEGGRTKPGHVDPALIGVGLIARLSGVPVIPVGIVGTERSMPVGAGFPRPAKVVVRFGRPLDPDAIAAGRTGREADTAFTTRLMADIQALVARRA